MQSHEDSGLGIEGIKDLEVMRNRHIGSMNIKC